MDTPLIKKEPGITRIRPTYPEPRWKIQWTDLFLLLSYNFYISIVGSFLLISILIGQGWNNFDEIHLAQISARNSLEKDSIAQTVRAKSLGSLSWNTDNGVTLERTDRERVYELNPWSG